MQKDLRIRLFREPNSVALLRDPDFVREWAALAGRCPWTTLYQLPVFVHSWLDVYLPKTEPVVIAGRDEHGVLKGLFLLGRCRRTGAVRVAGDKHCEYQAWLAEPEANRVFAPAALRILGAETGIASLTLLFVPRGVPMDWAGTHPRWRRRHWIDTETRHYLQLGPDFKLESIRAFRSYRQRLNKIARLPGTAFEYCADAAAFEANLDAIGDIVDFRQGGKNGVLPFRGDELKRPFHLRLARTPNLLHCTLLRIQDRLVSVEVNLCHNGVLIHGILAHRPEYSRYSVGRYHMLRLAELASKQGISGFDLTPSGDYKEDFSSQSEEAYIVRFYFSSLGMAVYRMRRWITARLSHTAIQRVQAHMDRLRELADRAKRFQPRSLFPAIARTIGRKLACTGELRLYRWPDGKALPSVRNPVAAQNCLSHLLAFQPRASWQPSVRKFLRDAASRLENGDLCFTRLQEGTLAHYGWLGWRERLAMPEVSQEKNLEKPAVVLYDFFTDPASRGQGLYQATLLEMLSTLRDFPPGTPLYITVMGSNRPSRHVIEKAGFEWQGSFFEQRRLFRVRRWKQEAP